MGKEVLIVQAKPDRLNLLLMGQAFFCVKLIKKHGPVQSDLCSIMQQG